VLPEIWNSAPLHCYKEGKREQESEKGSIEYQEAWQAPLSLVYGYAKRRSSHNGKRRRGFQWLVEARKTHKFERRGCRDDDVCTSNSSEGEKSDRGEFEHGCLYV
jgi:hypothetical protein